MTDLIKKVYDTDIDEHRVFLVVVDDSEEMLVALRFACMRAKNTGGRVALFRDIEPTGFHHWAGVSELMQDEARDAAEERLNELAEEVVELSGLIPAIYVRADDCANQNSEVACNDDTYGIQSQVHFPAEAGVTYYVFVDSYDLSGNFNLTATRGDCRDRFGF